MENIKYQLVTNTDILKSDTNNQSNNFHTELLFLTFIVLVIAGLVLIKKRKRIKKDQNYEVFNTNFDLNKEIESWFKKSLEEWKKECLGYNINKLALEKSIFSKKFEEFLRKKGLKRVHFEPIIKISWSLAKEKKKRIAQYLNSVGYDIKRNEDIKVLKEKIREYLLKKTQKEAENIINEYLQQKNKGV